MKLCIFSDRFPGYGAAGAGNVAADLAEAYSERGHEVSVVTTTRDPDEECSELRGGYRIRVIYAPQLPRYRAYYSIYNPHTIPEVKRLFERESFDAVHAHNVHEFLSYHTLRVAAKHSHQVVLTFHDAMSVEYGKLTHFVNEGKSSGSPPLEEYEVSAWRQLKRNQFRYFPLRNVLNRQYLSRYVDYRVAVSNELGRALQANGVPCDDVVHNGVDVDKFANGDGERFREKYGITAEHIILFSGRAGRWKGGGKLAEAFARVAGNYDVELVVTGSKTDYVSEMREIAGEHGDSIVSTGWIERRDLVDAYHAAAACATPSIYLDPFPTVNLEAMAAGTAVVTTCYGGAKELVDDGESGYIINPFKKRGFASRLEQLLGNKTLRSELGQNAEETIRREHNLRSKCNRYERYLLGNYRNI